MDVSDLDGCYSAGTSRHAVGSARGIAGDGLADGCVRTSRRLPRKPEKPKSLRVECGGCRDVFLAVRSNGAVLIADTGDHRVTRWPLANSARHPS